VTVGVPVKDAPGENVDVLEGVFEAVGDAVRDGDIVAEHESATARPVAVHPHEHGSGATDASGQ